MKKGLLGVICRAVSVVSVVAVVVVVVDGNMVIMVVVMMAARLAMSVLGWMLWKLLLLTGMVLAVSLLVGFAAPPLLHLAAALAVELGYLYGVQVWASGTTQRVRMAGVEIWVPTSSQIVICAVRER